MVLGRPDDFAHATVSSASGTADLHPVPESPRTSSAAAKHSRTQPARARRDARAAAGRWDRAHIGLLLGFDALALVIATALGVLAGATETGRMLGLAVIPIWMIWLAAIGAYDRRHIGSGSTEFAVVVGASLRVALAVIALAYLLRSDPARDVVFIMLPAGTGLLVLGRAFARVVTAACRRRGHGFHRVLVVGTVVDVLELVAQAAKSPSAGFQVIAACVPQYDGPSRRRRRVVGVAAHQPRPTFRTRATGGPSRTGGRTRNSCCRLAFRWWASRTRCSRRSTGTWSTPSSSRARAC